MSKGISFDTGDGRNGETDYVFPRGLLRSDLAVVFQFAIHASRRGRCKSDHVDIHYIHVGLQNYLQLHIRVVFGDGCIWYLGCDGSRLVLSCDLYFHSLQGREMEIKKGNLDRIYFLTNSSVVYFFK